MSHTTSTNSKPSTGKKTKGNNLSFISQIMKTNNMKKNKQKDCQPKTQQQPSCQKQLITNNQEVKQQPDPDPNN